MKKFKRTILFISIVFTPLILVSCSEMTREYTISEKESAGIDIDSSESNASESKKQVESTLEVLPMQTYASRSEEQVKSNTKSEEINRYEIKHEADGSAYWVTITQEDERRSMLTLYKNEEKLQSFDTRLPEVTDVDLIDLNSDGYMDILLGWNKAHDKQKGYQYAYVWDISTKSYTRVEYIGFDKLADYEVDNGCIRNRPRYYPDYLTVLQTLVFDDNFLMKIEEYYGVQHKKDGTRYWVSITQDDNGNYMLTLFDSGFEVLQQTSDNNLVNPLPDIDLKDLNSDGYMDVIVALGGTRNTSHEAYLWDISSQGYIKVVFEGFDMLAEIEVRDGYIDNFIRGDNPEDSCKEKLVFDGNVLKKVGEY